MKKIFILFFTLYAYSCTNLDLAPEDAFVDAVVFDNPEAYRSYLAKVYGAFTLTGQDGPAGDGDISIVNDEGFTSYIRSYWKAQELTTDEAVIGWTDAGIRDLHLHSWSSENQFVRVLYYRIFYIIAYANDFLTQSTPSKLDEHNINDEWKAKIATYRSEARFLRALAYWHALDLFRNVPILTKISTDLPSQATPQELFEFIESELIAIESEMVGPQANEYGRADRAALWMLQAKLYLNAEVYTGQAKYGEVITAVNKITAAGYNLYPNYFELFMADNHKAAAPYTGTPEVIFALTADGKNSQSWGNTTFLVHAGVGGTMSDNLVDGTEKVTGDGTEVKDPTESLDNYGIGSGWGGLRTTKNMVAICQNIIAPGDTDARVNFYTYTHDIEINDIGTFEDGYAVVKWVNLDSQGNPGTDSDFPETDYPIFRLGDAYLMYAEAFLRGGGGDAATALGYINALRQRAYGNNSANISTGELTLDFVLDERVRELYWEGTRRQDLIRYGQFSDQGIWPWKGGVMEGTTTSAIHDILPIPASDLNVNANLKQNPGY